MINLLAAEGGYQAFHLSGADWAWLFICLVAGMVGIVAGLLLARNVLAADQGTPKMIEIAKAIQEGAQAYLAPPVQGHRDHRHPAGRPGLLHRHQGGASPTAAIALTLPQDGLFRAICFLFGATFSGPDRVHRHEHGRAGQRAHRGRGRRGRHAAGGPEGRVPHRRASPACSASASACSAPPSSS